VPDWTYLGGQIEFMLEPLADGSLDSVEFIFKRFAVAYDKFPERVRMGCFMVNTSTSGMAADPGIEERAAHYREVFRSAFHGALDRAVERGEIEGPTDARADQLVLMQIGMFVSARSGAGRDEIRRLGGAVVAQIEDWRIDR
jgi:hypothetical protein